MMITIEEAQALRPEEKDAILEAVLGVAWTDGETQPEEIALLKRIACHLAEQDPATLLTDYKPDLERVGRKIARSDLGPIGRKVLLKSMAYMAAASGNVTDAERVFYRQCLLAFGVPEAQREKIEKQVRHAIYSELVRASLAAAPDGKVDGRKRDELDEKRRELDIDAPVAERIEDAVRRELA